MAGDNLGKLVVYITGDSSQFKRSLGESEGGLASFAKTAGATMAVASSALVAGFGASIVAATGFEKTMSGVKAVSGANADEMKRLSDLALKLGADTSFSASEAGKGIEELVKGGVSIADIMGGAALASLNLAAAGSIDLASASEIAANAMNMFGLKGSDMAHVSDLIAGAANASSLSVDDFRLSLQMSGAVAKLSGQSFDDLAQAIAVMGAQGIKGSDAGTSLKTMLMNLQPTTDKAMKTFQELGIVTASGANRFFDATGKAKGMRDIAEILSVSMSKLTQEQKLASLEIMFGSDAIRAGAILADAGAAGFDKMAASMGKVTAASVAAERLNNFAGSLEQLKGSVETAAISIGLKFLPGLKMLADQATAGVNAMLPWIAKIDMSGDSGRAAGDLIREHLGRVLPWITEQVPLLVAQLGQWASAFVGWVAPLIPPLLIELGGMASNLLDWIIERVPAVVGQLGQWAMAFVEWVAPRIAPLLVELGKLASQMLAWLTATAPALIEKILAEWVPAFVGWVAKAAIALVKELPTILAVTGDWVVREGAPGMAKFGLELGAALVVGVAKGIFNISSAIADALSEALGGPFARGAAARATEAARESGTLFGEGPNLVIPQRFMAPSLGPSEEIMGALRELADIKLAHMLSNTWRAWDDLMLRERAARTQAESRQLSMDLAQQRFGTPGHGLATVAPTGATNTDPTAVPNIEVSLVVDGRELGRSSTEGSLRDGLDLARMGAG